MVPSRTGQWRCPVHPLQSHMLPTPATSPFPSVCAVARGLGIHRAPYILGPTGGTREREPGSSKMPKDGQKPPRPVLGGGSGALAPLGAGHHGGQGECAMACRGPCPGVTEPLGSTKSVGSSQGGAGPGGRLGPRGSKQALTLRAVQMQGQHLGWQECRVDKVALGLVLGEAGALQLGLDSTPSPVPPWFSRYGVFQNPGAPMCPSEGPVYLAVHGPPLGAPPTHPRPNPASPALLPGQSAIFICRQLMTTIPFLGPGLIL